MSAQTDFISNDQYILHSITLTNWNGVKNSIRDVTVSFNIKESIFSNFCTGDILIEDSIDMLSQFPINGEETLKIAYSLNNETEVIHREFYVYNVSSVAKGKDTTQHLMLEFVSVEALAAANCKISTSYKGANAKAIISDMMANCINSNKNVVYGDSALNISHVFTTSSAAQIINKVCSMTQSVNKTRSAYLFFENYDGFVFENLEELYSKEIVATYQPTNMQVTTEVGKDNVQTMYTITDYSIVSTPNTLKQVNNGAYATRMKTYDPLTKDYRITDIDHIERFQQRTHLGKFHPKSPKFQYRDPKQGFQFHLVASNRTENNYFKTKQGVNQTYRSDQIWESKQNLLSESQAIKLEASITAALNFKAGDVIKLDLPLTTTEQRRMDEKDRRFSGKYLIADMKHSFSMNKVKTSVVLQKDCYDKDAQGGE